MFRQDVAAMSESATPPKKRTKFDFTEEFKVVLGKEKKVITVHKQVLTKSSDFFKKCCDGHDWLECRTKTIELPEQNPETFATYLQWLYTGEIVIGDDHELESAEGLSHQSRSTIAKRFYKPLRRLACLADELLDVTLTNVIVDYVLLVDSKASIVPIPEFIDTVYSKLPESSTLRQLLVDMMSHRITREPGWMKYLMKFHPEFLVDVLMSYASPFDEVKRTRKIRSTRENRCAHYHVHNDEVAKTADCLKPLV